MAISCRKVRVTRRGLSHLCLLLTASAFAQNGSAQTGRNADPLAVEQEQAPPQPRTPTAPPGQTATSAIGRAGERQTREQNVTGARPLARLDTRIQTRVQSRLRNRIDRTYDPQKDAASPFDDAGDRARTTNQSTRR